MKKLVFTIFATMFLLCGCNKTKQFEVTLNLSNADGKSVYLFKDVNGTETFVDSTVFVGEHAVLKAGFDDPQITYFIKFSPNDKCGIMPFFTENQNATITGDLNDMPHWTCEGCPTLNELNAYHQKNITQFEDKIMALSAEVITAYAEGDTVKGAELNEQMMTLYNAYTENNIEYIRSHPDSYLAHYLLSTMMPEMELEQVKEVYNSFTTESIYSKRVKEFIENDEVREKIIREAHSCNI